jgi:hypothetical protein
LGNGEVEFVNVVLVVSDLTLIEIAQGVVHGTGDVGCEVALGRIEKPGRVGESLLGCQLDFGMGKARDVLELPGDFGRRSSFTCASIVSRSYQENLTQDKADGW